MGLPGVVNGKFKGGWSMSSGFLTSSNDPLCGVEGVVVNFGCFFLITNHVVLCLSDFECFIFVSEPNLLVEGVDDFVEDGKVGVGGCVRWGARAFVGSWNSVVHIFRQTNHVGGFCWGGGCGEG